MKLIASRTQGPLVKSELNLVARLFRFDFGLIHTHVVDLQATDAANESVINANTIFATNEDFSNVQRIVAQLRVISTHVVITLFLESKFIIHEQGSTLVTGNVGEGHKSPHLWDDLGLGCNLDFGQNTLKLPQSKIPLQSPLISSSS